MRHNRLPAAVVGASLLLMGCGAGGETSTPGPEASPSPTPVAGTGGQSPVASEPLSRAPKVVFLGDSLTAGFGLAAQDALPDQVARALAQGGVEIATVNAGVSGDTTANGLARYDWSVASAKPDLLVVALGANDYLLGLSPDTARDNLAAIITRAQADGVPVLLAGIEPRSDAAQGSRDAAFAAIYPDLAAEHGVPLYPALLEGVRDNPELLQSDGVHPTADGVALMAERLGDSLLPQLESLAE